MSKKKVLKTMVFEVGDVIGFGGCENRVILSVNHKKQEYGIGFITDPCKKQYRWKMNDAHQIYELIPPKHIPREQHEKYREMNGRYKNNLC